MQFVRYTRWDERQCCPVTGLPLVDEEMNAVAPTLRGFWVDAVIEEPTITDPSLRQAWDAYLAEQEALGDDGFIDIEAFLTFFDRPGWFVWELESKGIACGPVSTTTWAVIDMEFEVEEE